MLAAPGMASAAVQKAVMLSPIGGRVTWSAPNHRDTGIGGDWNMDIGGTGSVYARFTNFHQPLQLRIITVGPGCGGGRSGGQAVKVGVIAGGVEVGWVSYVHLTNVAVAAGQVHGNGVRLGDVATGLPNDSLCWTGPHVHIEPYNYSRYSCYVAGLPENTAVGASTMIGVVGGEYASARRQACPAGATDPPGGGGGGGTYPDGTFLRTSNGAVYRVAGGAPLAIACNDLNGCDGGNWINVDQSVIDAMPAVVRDRTFLRTPNGAVYRVAGGAPLAITCNDLNGCDGGNWVNISHHPITAHDHLRTLVADRTYLRTPNGAIYRVAGGAAFYLNDCSVLNGCDGGAWVNISQHPIDARDHLRSVALDGTVVEGRPSAMLWRIIGGQRSAVAPPQPSAVALTDAAVASIPFGPPSFADVPPTHQFFAHIEQLHARGITTGCGRDAGGRLLFCPTDDVSRQAMAAFIVRAKGLQPLTPATASFADVPTSHPFYGHIERLREQGITSGCGRNGAGQLLFCPTASVPRQAMAAFLIRAFP